MTNTLSPSGFREYGTTDGITGNFGMQVGKCLYTTGPLFSGDPLVISAGYLAAASVTGNTGAAVAGVAKSFSWTSIAQGRTVRQNYYPGNDSVGNADVTVHYTKSIGALFQVQVTSSSAGTAVGGPITQARVGYAINFATGAGGNTLNQMSSFSVDNSTTTATSTTLPFYIYALVGAPVTDPTSAGNLVIVGFNNLSKS